MALTDDLVSYWKLDEASGTRVDAHGSNDLTDNNTVGSATGKINSAASFSRGSNEELTSSAAAFSRGNQDWTWTGWVNCDDPTLAEQGPVQKGESTEREWGIIVVSGAPWGRLHDSSNALIASAQWGSSFTADTWHFVVVWLSTADNKLYLSVDDGTSVSATLTGTPRSGTTADFRIGNYSGSDWWGGLIDESGFWTRVLTSQERTDLYNSGNGLAYPFTGGAKPFLNYAQQMAAF